jgi:hypothetical protein
VKLGSKVPARGGHELRGLASSRDEERGQRIEFERQPKHVAVERSA